MKQGEKFELRVDNQKQAIIGTYSSLKREKINFG